MSPEERIADLDRSEAQARAEVERLKEDSELLDLASELLIGADFQWGDPPTPILALGPIPKPVRVGVDLREDLRRIRDLRRASGAAAPPAGTGDAALRAAVQPIVERHTMAKGFKYAGITLTIAEGDAIVAALATVPAGPGEPSEAAIDAAWQVPSQPFTGLDTARDNIRAMLRAAYAAERAALAGAASPSQKGQSE